MDFVVFTKLGNAALLGKGRNSINILNKRIYIRSTSDILLNQGHICNAFMNKLYDIPNPLTHCNKRDVNHKQYRNYNE